MSEIQDYGRLRDNKPFIFVWLAGICAMLGFAMLFLTTSWYVIDELERPALVGLVLVMITVPRVIMMVFGGVVADRIKKSKIMFTTNLLQTLLISTMAYLVTQDQLGVAALVIITFLFGFFDAFFYPAVTALIPILVGRENIQRANSLFHGSIELMFMFGPVIAGILLTVSTFGTTMTVAAIFVSLSVIFVHPRLIQDEKPKQETEFSKIKDDFVLGMRYIKQSPIISSGIITISLVNLFVIGPIIISFPLIVDALDGTAFHLSLLEVGLSVGTFTGSIIVYKISAHKRRGRIIVLTLIATMIGFFVYSRMEILPALMVLAAVVGFAAMIVYLQMLTVIQEHTPHDRQGRVMSIATVASEGFAPVAFAVVSLFVGIGLTIHDVLAWTAAIGIICSIWLAFKAKALMQAQ
ncbi:MFS transporter [Alkalibacillus haloalkaliphilus]|uniref:MFS transporter n=1 Tax=Alkalibacillus haloalkaliphilus TaxID=94136 RepID=UPI0029364247|nr:MFS transporter [Alkalibacillus haloalkaliphilus]MDV2582895.1 MFS transporter [Alkalibacillus haloalkaliphilus]